MASTVDFLSRHGIDFDQLTSTAGAHWPPVGLTSPDETAISCKDEWLDIYKGSNNYYEFYHLNTSDALFHAIRWLRSFDAIERICHAKGCDFFISIVPNKLTIMSDSYPLPVPGNITPVFNWLHIMHKKGVGHAIGHLDTYRQYAKSIFRRNDSHMTLLGTYIMIGDLLDRIGVPLDDMPAPNPSVTMFSNIGDLGSKFKTQAAELVARFDGSGGLVNQQSEIATPARGGVGLTVASRCEAAKQERRLLVFGNSYFDRDPGWAAAPIVNRTFKDVMFRWSDRIDPDLIDAFRPDVVVFQTCERFLARTPESP